MTNRQFRIELTQGHFERDGLRSLIKESAVRRSLICVGDRAVKIPLRRAVDESLDAGRICGRSDKKPISPIRDAEGVFVRRT